MAGGGYVKLWRKMLDSEVIRDAFLCQLWVWCLLRANWKTDSHGERGTFVCKNRHAAEILNVSKSKFNRGIHELVTLGCITLDVGHGKTIVKVCNYDTYQTSEVDPRDKFGTSLGQVWDKSAAPSLVSNEELEEHQEATGVPIAPKFKIDRGYFMGLEAEAKAVVQAYNRDVGSAHRAGSQAAAVEFLGNMPSVTQAQLLVAIGRFGATVKNSTPDRRPGLKNWLRDGAWQDFVGDDYEGPDANIRAKSAARIAARDAEIERRRKEAAEYVPAPGFAEELARRRAAKAAT